MRLCLNMIVKNEASRVKRALETVAPHIVSWVIVDTGSTDDTKKIITEFFKEKNIPGLLGSAEFKNFSQARNIALTAARNSPFEFDYILLMDADMELKVLTDPWTNDIQGESFDMYQTAGAITYQNRRLVRKDTTGEYKCVTHEYLDVATGGCIPASQAYFVDHADGSNRTDKFKRDIKLIKEALKTEPNNERYFFYLAQSYRDAGNPAKAAEWYKRRVDAGGWDEEVWSAQTCYAHCLKDMGHEAKFIKEMERAYQMRPSRAESIYDLAKHYREKGMNNLAVMFAREGMRKPKSKDALFVNDYVYECGCQDEFAITAFYQEENREEGFDVCNRLALKKGPYQYSRELARNNLFFYYKMLSDYCPSFKWQPIAPFEPSGGFIAMNPSIAMNDNRIYGIVRTVNYKIDEHGRYLIRGTDGTANGTNPINTRNFFVKFRNDLVVDEQQEILHPVDHPKPKFDLVIGFEDMRLFTVGDEFRFSATVREFTPEGWCEQVTGKLAVSPTGNIGDCRIGAVQRMTERPRVHEKNWMPVQNRNWAQFMYRANELVNSEGKTVWKRECKFDVEALSGGSQVVPIRHPITFEPAYLCVVHEARQIPGRSTRYYVQRFIRFDGDMNVEVISKPFGLHEKCIEYVSGLVVKDDKIVLSYGFQDCHARLAIIDKLEVEKFLHDHGEHV